jgi:hypothetical protein
MDFNSGKNVRVKHFAGKYCNKAEIMESAGGILTIKPEKSFTVFSFFEEDPVVLFYENDAKYFICQCSIISIDYINSTFNIILENHEEFNNRRQAERYPTSLYGVSVNSPGKETVFINNISTGGVSIKTKLNLNTDENFEVEATLDGTYIYLNGMIKWKRAHNNFFEYGVFSDESVPQIQELLDIVKREHFLIIRNFKYENNLAASL